MKTNPVLEVENLSVEFGGVKALNQLSFSVQAGEVFTVVGPNGAGKSTLFNVISRFYQPSHGRVLVSGRDLARITAEGVAALGVARSFQNIELFEHATVLQNLLLGRHRHHKGYWWSDLFFLPATRAAEMAHRAAVEKVIDFLDLQSYRDKMILGLPYGVRKIVELGRALAMEPMLLLLDEPASGLSPEETQELGYWIEDLQKEWGVTVLMIEHDMLLVNQVSTRVLAIDHGAFLALGTPAEVAQNPEVIAAYLGEQVESVV